MADPLDPLQARFGIDGAVRFDTGEGDLRRIVVSTPASEAHVYLLGAHVTHFRPRDAEGVLFLSERSWYAVGKPIRGGVPICFPWFGLRAEDPAAPNHGLARLLEWQVVSAARSDGGDVALVLRLCSDGRTRAAWPHDFELTCAIGVGRRLSLSLRTRNLGTAAFTYEQALHTYLAVGDVAAVQVHGLEDTAYHDKVDGMARRRQGPGPVAIGAETDRIYVDTAATCVVEDPVLDRRIALAKSGSRTTVLWNPWVAKARAMPDFGDEEWRRMLCVESGVVGADSRRLDPGCSAVLGVEIGIEPRRPAA